MERTCEQAWLMGAHIVFTQQVIGLESGDDNHVVDVLDGTKVRARTVVIATGVAWRRLGLPRLEALVGSGVFYGAAMSESRGMQDHDVFIVGAGNSAGQAAVHLAKYARTVTLVIRADSFSQSMSSYLVGAIESTSNIRVRLRTQVTDGGGDGHLEHLELTQRGRDGVEHVPAAALFIMIGGEPHTQWLPHEIARDTHGYILTGRDIVEANAARWDLMRDPLPLETSIAGVFATGDVRHGLLGRRPVLRGPAPSADA
jgi:thioredoxin reductase (NADPH)